MRSQALCNVPSRVQRAVGERMARVRRVRIYSPNAVDVGLTRHQHDGATVEWKRVSTIDKLECTVSACLLAHVQSNHAHSRIFDS
jgi:hypothetical protein